MIDVHAHHWPAGLLRALARGNSWFGWEPVVLRSGARGLALGDRLVRFAPPQVDLEDLDGRLQRRTVEHGVVVEAVMPVGFLWGEHLPEGDAVRFVREVNDELAAAQAARPDRFRGIGVLPFHAPRVFGRELAGIVERGLTAVAVPTNVRGAGLDDHTVLPLVEEALDADLAVVLHPTYLTPAGAERMPRYYFSNSFGAPLESAMALMSLVHAGLFDRRPQARVLALNGAGCLPYEVGRFDGRYAEREDVRSMWHRPSDYLRSAHYDCMVLDRRSLRLLVDRVGAERVMVGTDHPFRTDVPGGAVAWVRSDPALTAQEKEQILWRTASRFLRLGLTCPPDPGRGG